MYSQELLLAAVAPLLAVFIALRSISATAFVLYIVAALLGWVSPWEFLWLLLWGLGVALLPYFHNLGGGLILLGLIFLAPRGADWASGLILAGLYWLYLTYVAAEGEEKAYRAQAALAAMPLPMAVYESAPLAAAASAAVFAAFTLTAERRPPPKSLLAFVPSTAAVAAGFVFNQLSLALAAAAVINAVAATAMLMSYLIPARRVGGEPLLEINVARNGRYLSIRFFRRKRR